MIHEITSSQDQHWQPLLRLFHATFPPETREPDEQLVAEADRRYRLPFRYLVWLDPGVVGFMRFATLPRSGVEFVVHIAVAPSHRGRGIAAELLARAAPPIVAEVEVGAAMRFWSKQGARTISETYTQPALRPETPPMPFHLMAIGEITDPERLVECFYEEVWEREADDPMVRRATEGAR